MPSGAVIGDEKGDIVNSQHPIDFPDEKEYSVGDKVCTLEMGRKISKITWKS